MITLASIRTLALGLSVTLSLCAAACSVEPAVDSSEEAITAPSIVGKYQFVWEGDRKAEVYAELAKKLSGAELEAAKREADEEAAASHLEFDADGVFHSYIGKNEIGTWKYELEPVDATTVRLKKPGTDEAVTVELENDTIIINDPRKGPLTFRRTK
jgi:hypothetical protein